MNLVKEAHFTPPEEEVQFMCAMRRETQFLQAYSKIPACKNFNQRDSKVQRDKWISEVIHHENFSLSIFWKLTLVFLMTTTNVTLTCL